MDRKNEKHSEIDLKSTVEALKDQRALLNEKLEEAGEMARQIHEEFDDIKSELHTKAEKQHAEIEQAVNTVREKAEKQHAKAELAADAVRDEIEEAEDKCEKPRCSLLGAAGMALGTAFVVQQGAALLSGLQFRKSIDKNYDSLDSCLICGRETLSYPCSEMKDLKIGCFSGKETVDLRGVKTEALQYDLDIKVDNGTLTIIVPEDWHMHITSRLFVGDIRDETQPDNVGQDGPLLSVYAEVTFGRVIFKNA